MKRVYTDAQKAEAIRLLIINTPLKEVEKITGIKVNTLKTLKRNHKQSNQTVTARIRKKS